MMEKEELQPELSIVMPCLNEAKTVGICIQKASRFLKTHHICGEIIVADNGSCDGSQEIAVSLGAEVIPIEKKGYGSALMGGIAIARGRYIIMGDADDSYDFGHLLPFVEKLRAGDDLVMGNRFTGGIKKDAMPFLHKYLGNPVLTGIGRLFFHSPCRDFHCGLRGFSKEAVTRMQLQTTGMEFASEMVIKAALMNMRVSEVPTTLSPDGRDSPPHLRTWRDGWRHLRFMLLYSPTWLFLIPGLLLLGIGFILLLTLVWGPLHIGGLFFDFHYMILGSLLTLLGIQVASLGIYARVYAISQGFQKKYDLFRQILDYFNLERGILFGGIIFTIGFIINVYILLLWLFIGFGGRLYVREAIMGMTLVILGAQTVFSSFFLSMLVIEKQ